MTVIILPASATLTASTQLITGDSGLVTGDVASAYAVTQYVASSPVMTASRSLTWAMPDANINLSLSTAAGANGALMGLTAATSWGPTTIGTNLTMTGGVLNLDIDATVNMNSQVFSDLGGLTADGGNFDLTQATALQLHNTALKIGDSADDGEYLTIKPGSDLSVDRILTLTTGDAARTLTIGADTTLGGGSHSGTNTGGSGHLIYHTANRRFPVQRKLRCAFPAGAGGTMTGYGGVHSGSVGTPSVNMVIYAGHDRSAGTALGSITIGSETNTISSTSLAIAIGTGNWIWAEFKDIANTVDAFQLWIGGTYTPMTLAALGACMLLVPALDANRVVGTSTPQPYDPEDVSDTLDVWFRADIGVSLNAGAVATWEDKRLNGKEAIQITGSKQPDYNETDSNFNGHATLSFDADAQQGLNYDGVSRAQPYTAFVVVKLTNNSARRYVFDSAIDGLGRAILATQHSGDTGVATYAGTWYVGSPDVVDTDPHYYSAVYYDASESSITVDGGSPSIATVGSSNLTPLSIASNTYHNSDWWHGEIAEILIYYGSGLSAEEKSGVESYLAWRYDL